MEQHPGTDRDLAELLTNREQVPNPLPGVLAGGLGGGGGQTRSASI